MHCWHYSPSPFISTDGLDTKIVAQKEWFLELRTLDFSGNLFRLAKDITALPFMHADYMIVNFLFWIVKKEKLSFLCLALYLLLWMQSVIETVSVEQSFKNWIC